ncbi:MAG TPA: FtsQ-type POTRA domain-containing protein [Candidatus Paceibacterota bacterium]|nr:FtsQ-type POTRA domain-containing protein [Candidatus Paceibacterota bacterium]
MKTPKEIPASWSDVHSRKRRKYHRIFFAISLVAAYFIFVLAAWTVVYSPLFKIKSIDIIGNKNVSNDDIMTLARADILHGSFIKQLLGTRNILIWPSDFSSNILEYYPEIRSISISKNYIDRKIIISVEERQPFGAWCLKKAIQNPDNFQAGYDSNCFWFDDKGFIFERTSSMEGSLFTVVDDYSQKTPGIRSKILPDGLIENAFSVFRAINASGLRVKEIRLNDIALEELEVDTYDGLSADMPVRGTQAGSSAQAGPTIYFSLRFPADNVPDIINSLKQKSIFNGLQYVDFRVENRVYYK